MSNYRNVYTFEQINFNFGIAIVCTRFPLIMSLISIVSVVNAIIYGNEHTEEIKNKIIKRFMCHKVAVVEMIVNQQSNFYNTALQDIISYHR